MALKMSVPMHPPLYDKALESHMRQTVIVFGVFLSIVINSRDIFGQER